MLLSLRRLTCHAMPCNINTTHQHVEEEENVKPQADLCATSQKKTDRKYVTGRYNGYRRYGIPQRQSTPSLESCDERRRASDSDLLPRDLEPDDRHKILLEPLPQRAIQVIAQFPEIIHLTPTIASPLTPRHINHKIPFFLAVMNSSVVSIFRACPFGEAVDFALWDECGVGSDPRLVDVEEFEGVLFFVLPFHVLLLVPNRVPPYVK